MNNKKIHSNILHIMKQIAICFIVFFVIFIIFIKINNINFIVKGIYLFTVPGLSCGTEDLSCAMQNLFSCIMHAITKILSTTVKIWFREIINKYL